MTAPVAPKKPSGQFDQVGEAQDYLREGVIGYGEMLKPELLRQIGTTLGGLNDIGGLRSGGTKVALEDIATDYGNQVGAYAKMASSSGLDAGLRAHEQKFREDEAARRRRGGLLRAIGSALGMGLGFIANAVPGGGVVKRAISSKPDVQDAGGMFPEDV